MSGFTQEQLQFIHTSDKNVLALAGAGAGKTHSLVGFIDDKIKKKISSDQLVCFSFTRKAANELKSRTENHFKKHNLEFKYISTIHSFCWNEIIKPLYKDLGFTNIPSIIFDYPNELLIAEFKAQVRKNRIDDETKFKNRWKDTVTKDLQKEDITEEEALRCLKYIMDNNLIMFDFMVHLVNFLLEASPELIADKFSKVQYMITDEAQDLNPAQYKFLKLMKSAFPNINLVLVGDVKQSIYKFRGSDPKLISKFIDEFDPEIVFLSHNFRSAPEIVEIANQCAQTIDLGHEKLNACKTSIAAKTDEVGDIFKIHDVEEFLEELKNITKPYHQTCILGRTNTFIKAMAKILGKLGIPYYLHTEYDIMKRKEVKVFMGILNLATHEYNRALVLEMIKHLKGGIPLKMSSAISKVSSMKDFYSLFKDIKMIPEIFEIHEDVAKGNIQVAIPKLAKLMEETKKPAERIQQSLERFYRDLNEVKKNEGLDTWVEALEELLFEAQFLEQKAENKVQIMTLHKAKGLEWDNVIFVYDFQLLECVDHDFYDIEEEKRVVYTAFTRPRQSLVIWDLPNQENRDYFQNSGFERLLTMNIKRGWVNIDDFPK